MIAVLTKQAVRLCQVVYYIIALLINNLSFFNQIHDVRNVAN